MRIRAIIMYTHMRIRAIHTIITINTIIITGIQYNQEKYRAIHTIMYTHNAYKSNYYVYAYAYKSNSHYYIYIITLIHFGTQ